MAKQTGLGWTTCTIQDAALVARDVRTPVTSLDFSTPYAQQEVTGLVSSATERLALLADFTGTLNSVFDPGANSMHAVMSGDLRIAREMVLAVGGKSLTNTVLFSDYSLSRGAGGEFTCKHPFALSSGTVPAWA